MSALVRKLAAFLALSLAAMSTASASPAAVISVINTTTGTCASGSTSCTATLSATPKVGDILIVVTESIQTSANPIGYRATSCGGAGGLTIDINQSDSAHNRMYLQHQIVPASPTTACTLTVSDGTSTNVTGSYIITEFAGVNLANPVDSSSIGLGSWGSHTSTSVSGTITPTFSLEYPFCAMAAQPSVATTSFTGGSGFTWTNSTNASALGSTNVGFASPQENSKATFACTANFSGTDQSITVGVMLQPIPLGMPWYGR